jgi:hypothetical protein
VPPSFLRAP